MIFLFLNNFIMAKIINETVDSDAFADNICTIIIIGLESANGSRRQYGCDSMDEAADDSTMFSL